MEEISELRLEGKVSLEISELCVKLFWIHDVKNKKTFKDNLLKEFAGKLIIDFRRRGAAIIMNDMVVLLDEELNFDSFKAELIHEHERTRGNDVIWPSVNQAILSGAEKLSGNLSVTFYEPQRKILAQAKPGPLKHFVTYYCNVMNKLKLATNILPRNVMAASQEPEIDPLTFHVSQEQSEPEESHVATDGIVTRDSSITADVQQASVEQLTQSNPIDATDSTDSELTRLDRIEQQICETNEIIKRTTFADFQKITFQELRDIKENQKSILLQLPIIKELTGKIEEIETRNKADMARMNERVLLIEEENKNMKASLSDAHTNNRSYKASVNKLAVDVGELSDEISRIRSELVTLPVASSCNCDIVSLSSALEKIKSDLNAHKTQHDLALGSFEDTLRETKVALQVLSIAPVPIQNTPEIQVSRLPAHQPEDYVIDAEVVVFHDSNGYKLKADILNHKTSVQKVLAYTVPEAIAIMSRATFASIPRKILLHLGTNDVETAGNPTEIEEKFTELLDLIRVRCPDTEIFFSSVLARRDLMNRVKDINSILQRLASRAGCHLVGHDNISSDMLRDKKHLNKTGFYVFLANIRFFMFGKNSKLFRNFGRPNSY